MTLHVPALVVGGGISGLVCAHALRRGGVETLLVEACRRAGGAIQTERREGYLIELGPQSFAGTTALRKLIAELGIESELLEAPPGAPRFVLVNGALRQVPLSPPAFLRSGFVGLQTKWAIARDALGKSAPPEQEESVGAFVRRKFSAELLDRLVGPFVSGVYAGDPERLSLRSAFPTLYEAEKTKGSVIRGLRSKSGEEPRRRPTLLSFREGAETLVGALCACLGKRRLAGVEVIRLQLNQTGAEGKYRVTTGTSGKEDTILADHVVLATPMEIAGKLLRDLEPSADETPGEIEYAPVAVVSLGYRRTHVGHALDGFGFLVPRSAGLCVLGTVWNSSLFPGRAPAGHVLLTSFLGGATDPKTMALSREELACVTHSEIAAVLAIGQAPSFSQITIYPRALPQYNLGHADRLAALERRRLKLPNLWLAGNYLRGPSIGACVEQSFDVAQEILSRAKIKQ